MRGLPLLLVGLLVAGGLAWVVLARPKRAEPEDRLEIEVRRPGEAPAPPVGPPVVGERGPEAPPSERRAPVLAVYDEAEAFPDVEEHDLVERQWRVPEGEGPVLASEVLKVLEKDGFYHLRTLDRALLERLPQTPLEGLERGQSFPYAHLQVVFDVSGFVTHRPDPRKPYLLLLPEGASLDRWIPRPEPRPPGG